jgi:hypothetical protein
MASGDRFYQLEFRHRPVLHGDISSLLKIDGLIVSGGGARAFLFLPSAVPIGTTFGTIPKNIAVEQLSDQEWVEFLAHSDDPEVLVGPSKAFHRKARYEISGIVQQKIWVADNYACVYCGREMGKVQLTIDHFIPLEMGGANDTSNYLSACRKCNKDKCSQDPKEWCDSTQYLELQHHLKMRVIP